MPALHRRLLDHDAAPEVARRLEAAHEVFRDRLARLDVLREAAQHVELEDVVLEEARRRLHEVVLRGSPEARPRDHVAAHDPVYQMAELVEEGDDLLVFHERGPVRHLRVGEVAHEHVVRQLPAYQAELVTERGRPLVLARPRMHVEGDEAGGLSIHGHREVLGVLVPRLGIDLGEDKAEELRREVQDRLPHRAVFEIGTHLARVKLETLVLRSRDVVLHVPHANALDAAVVPARDLQQCRVLAISGSLGRGAHVVEEAVELRGRRHHLVLEVVRGEVRVAKRLRELVPRVPELVEDLDVAPSPVVVRLRDG